MSDTTTYHHLLLFLIYVFMSVKQGK